MMKIALKHVYVYHQVVSSKMNQLQAFTGGDEVGWNEGEDVIHKRRINLYPVT